MHEGATQERLAGASEQETGMGKGQGPTRRPAGGARLSALLRSAQSAKEGQTPKRDPPTGSLPIRPTPNTRPKVLCEDCRGYTPTRRTAQGPGLTPNYRQRQTLRSAPKEASQRTLLGGGEMQR